MASFSESSVRTALFIAFPRWTYIAAFSLARQLTPKNKIPRKWLYKGYDYKDEIVQRDESSGRRWVAKPHRSLRLQPVNAVSKPGREHVENCAP